MNKSLLVPGLRAFPVIEFQKASAGPAVAAIAFVAGVAANDDSALEAA